MSEFQETAAKSQDRVLSAVKSVQDAGVKAAASFGEAIADYGTQTRKVINGAPLPSATELIESAFGFTTQLIELQKSYYLKLVDAMIAAQKKAVSEQ